MNDIVATKEHPAPLDAFETAKPDEPIFTLQGGDPLAAPLVRLWAFFARRRAATVRITQDVFGEIIEAAIGHSVQDDEREQGNLLVRATAAEKVSWAMDAYRKGNTRADVPSEAADTHLDELQRIDLHDLRVRIAGRLSNFRCEMVEMQEALTKHGYDDADMLQRIDAAAVELRAIYEAVEPRRMFKKG